MRVEIVMTGFIETDWPDDCSLRDVAANIEDPAALPNCIALINRVGQVTVTATPAGKKQAEAFQKNLAILRKPHNS